jgi:hypothetical protein
MTFQEDLSPCTYWGGADGPLSKHLIAVGWLEVDKPYRQGSISPELRAKLGELLADPWNPFMTLGVHECTLCGRPHRGPSGWQTLFVPGERGVFAVPELIHHYVDHHRYQPPDEFCRALESCPPMASPEYLRGLERGLGPHFVRMNAEVQGSLELRQAVAGGEPYDEAVERVFAKYRHLADPE